MRKAKSEGEVGRRYRPVRAHLRRGYNVFRYVLPAVVVVVALPRVGVTRRDKGLRGVAISDLDAAQLRHKVYPPVLAAKFAIDHHRKSDLLLHAHDVANRRILGLAQGTMVDRAMRELCAGIEQRWRAEQAADLVGAKNALAMVMSSPRPRMDRQGRRLAPWISNLHASCRSSLSRIR